ncbi:F-box protein CPR1-like [Euphorbia lathyris]|uniref:F-box protein CPR1-like n=1 Tax=Euphorbia lathyris TaxID=212925 RepID=UPI003313FC28
MDNQVCCGRVTTDGVPDQLAHKVASLAELPEDLIFEILLFSPVKAILCFRCLSKSFCRIIDSEEFINMHYSRSAENKKHRKLIIRERAIGRWSNRSVNVFDVDSGLEETINKPYKRNPKPYGYCNGLILLFVDSFRLALWNPSTQKYRNLPRCPIKVPNGGHCTTVGMGLGYDSTRGDYKVVLIEDVQTVSNTHVLQSWVFGLRSNSWKRVQDFPERKDGFIYFGHFANGYLHWLCKYRIGEYALVTFDMAKETIVSQSLYPAFSRLLQIDLHVIDGCLCLSCVSWNPAEAVFYVREKDGTKLKWSTLFSVTTEMPILFDMNRFKDVRVLGYSNDGDKVMLDLGFKFIVLYDVKQKFFSSTESRKLDDDRNKVCNYPFLCHESLVSLGGGVSQRKSGQKRKKRT